MTLAVLILVAVWLLASVLVVCLCRVAKQGDDAQAQPVLKVHRLSHPAQPRRTTPQRPRHAAHAGRTRR